MNNLRSIIKQKIDKFKKDINVVYDNKILTPKIGKRVLYTTNYAIVTIFSPKIIKNGPKKLVYRNHSHSIKASEETIAEAKKSWKPSLVYLADYIYEFSEDGIDYKLITDILYEYSQEADPKTHNCLIEESNLEDIVSKNTFDTFKDLYDFTKI
jgi:hypothetical protein